jgi:hypothetical protein
MHRPENGNSIGHMRNCLILGSPRGGTSLLAGTLSRAGYFMGDDPWPADEFNPKGQFEDMRVNWINEDLLESVAPKAPRRPIRWVYRRHDLRYGQRWLSVVPPDLEVRPWPAIASSIEELVSREPFCFKDPRFSYTLPAWRPFLRDTVLLCVFREPARTANSIIDCIDRNPHLSNVSMQFDQALEVWTSMYERIVRRHRHEGDWVFTHYEQIMDGTAHAPLSLALGVEPDFDFPTGHLRRSPSTGDLPDRVREVYSQLCDLAGYRSPVAV